MSIIDQANLPHTLTFQTQTYTKSVSGIGGSKPTPVAAYTGKKGWVQSASHSEIEDHGKQGQKITHKVLMDPDDEALLEEGQTLLVSASDPGTFVGSRFEVRSCGEATAGLGWLSTVFVEKL